jgi:hypothetical protein
VDPQLPDTSTHRLFDPDFSLKFKDLRQFSTVSPEADDDGASQ